MTSFITKIEEEEEQQLLQNRVRPIPLGNWKLVIEALFSTLKKHHFPILGYLLVKGLLLVLYFEAVP